MKPSTHAQHSFQRRIENRKAPHGPQFGKPIQGELTPAELAHLGRRERRRPEILKTRLKEVTTNLAFITKDLELFEKNIEKSPELKSEIERLNLLKITQQALANKHTAQITVCLANLTTFKPLKA